MKPAAEMRGHSKKVLSVQWHPICNNVMSTSSIDNTVRLWDVENQKPTLVFSKVPSMASCLRWAPEANLMSLSCKAGKFLVFDIRKKNELAGEVKCHDGPKAQKNCWLN